MKRGLLSDLLVLDCSSFVAGPAAASMLSDFGARVIKIEPPGEGDPLRHLIEQPGAPVSEHNYFWMLDNRNKESLALDLTAESARSVFQALVARADVLITNFPGPIRDRLKLRYQDVRVVNERLVYASLTAYGEHGPEKNRRGFDATAWWARSGLMHWVRPSADAEPARSVTGMGDHPTAVALFAAIVLALYRRLITGQGGEVSTSLLANGLWANASYVQAALCGATFVPRAPRYARNALMEVYRCKDDRWFMLSMVNQMREWPFLAASVGKPEWATDPRFSTPESRLANAEQLTRALEEVFGLREYAVWQELFLRAGVTFGEIAQPEDHIDCPQVAANNLLPALVDAGDLRTVDSPLRLTGEIKTEPKKAPSLGQHTSAILRELGFDAAEIARMQLDGAIGGAL